MPERLVRAQPLAVRVEVVGPVEDLVVAVAGRVDHPHVGAFRDRHAAELGVGGGHPEEALDRRLEAQLLLQASGQVLGVRAYPSREVGSSQSISTNDEICVVVVSALLLAHAPLDVQEQVLAGPLTDVASYERSG